MKLIPLTQGKFAQVDDADYDFIIQWNWTAQKSSTSSAWYAVRARKIMGVRVIVRMHRVLVGVENPKFVIDHKDGDGLNNQKSNLRCATYSQNSCNAPKKKKNGISSSEYKGVHKTKRGQWKAQINRSGKRHHIGYFKTEKEAAEAFNIAAKKHHGEFARLNSIK